MKILRFPVSLGLVAILFLLLGAGEKAKTVIISGVVQDEKGKPLANVIVESSYAGERYSTQTGADGKYTLQIAQGKLRFPESKLSVPVVARSQDGRLQAFSGSDAKPEDPLVLRPAREFAITVNDANNQPVAGAQILVVAGYMQVGEAITDNAGKATLRTPANATLQYILAAKPEAGIDYILFWRKDEARSDPYRLEPDFTGPLTFTLNGVKKVSVHVVDEQDKPIQGVNVYPWLFDKPKKGEDVNLSGTTYFKRMTDVRGVAEFFIPSDNARPINFWANLEGYTSLKRWMWDPKSADQQVEVKLIKQLRIVGRVIDVDRKPAAGAWVSINGASYESFDGVYHGTYTDEAGTFESLIDPDMYYMFLARKGQGASLPVLLMIGRQITDPVELTLEPGILLQALITAGPEKKPLAGVSVTLSQDDGQSYYKLPKEQKFPGDGNGRRAIYLSAARHGTSDKHGVAEFYIGPGSYQLRAYVPGETSSKAVSFELAENGQYTLRRFEGRIRQEEKHAAMDERMQINLHYDELNAGPRLLQGRVVLRDKPDVGVADAILSVVNAGDGPHFTRGVSDRQGKFSLPRGKSDLYVQAISADGKQRGIALVKAGENDVALPLGATASVRGRVLDHAGNILAGSTITYGVRIAHSQGTFSTSFGGEVKTTPDGWFTIDGLVPGFEYTISVAELGEDGRPRLWRPLTKTKPSSVERIELGNLTLATPYQPKTFTDYAAEAFAKTEPFEQRLAAAVRRAKLSCQNVMMVLGGANSKPVQRFFQYRYDFRNAEFWNAMMDHWLMAVETEKPSDGLGAWANRNNIRLAGPGFAIVILDTEGNVLAQSTSDLLSANGELDRRLVMEFAKKYAPAKPDGRKLFDEALAKAKAEGKKVLLETSSPYCGPCYAFAEYLEANKELIGREYACVMLDHRFPGAPEIFKSLGAATSTPWIAILDADGKKLATSDGPEGNVGFEKPQWEKMLRATAAKLTPEQIKALLEKVKE